MSRFVWDDGDVADLFCDTLEAARAKAGSSQHVEVQRFLDRLREADT